MSSLRPLGAHVAAHQNGQKRRLAAWSRERFVSAATTLASPTARWRTTRRRLAFLATLTLATAVASVVLWGRARKPVTFTVGDGVAGVHPTDVVCAPGDRTLPLRFSDGTRFELEPSTTARVVDARPAGARVVIDDGQARIVVPPGRGGLWFVDAGPYRVRIVGTRLDVAWRRDEGRVVVSLHEGHVEVSGGKLPQVLAVGAGQTLTASAHGGDWRLAPQVQGAQEATLAPAAPGEAAVPAPLTSPTSPPPAAAATPPREGPRPNIGPVRSPRASAPAALPAWRQLAAAGQFQAAMQRAEDAGFSGLCDSATATDLLTLSEVARFTRQSARAKEALLSLRRRFHDRPEASVAAFVLGRLAFEEDRDYRAAALWFGRYLDSSVEAPLAREAAGRLIEALAKAGDPAAARAAARRYLDRYPDGPHARFAAETLKSAR